MSRHFMVFAIVSALAVACSSSTDLGTAGSTNGTSPAGDANGSGGGNGNDPGGGGGANAKYSCCINDVFYKCPDQAAFDKCAGTPAGGQGCEAKCAPADIKCIMACADARANASHDPSACTKTTEACPASNSCNNIGSGSCSVDGDCGSGNHCTQGCCLGNAAGAPCDVDGDCGSNNHCTGGKCYANRVGSPCDVDGDCGSGNECTNGRCR